MSKSGKAAIIKALEVIAKRETGLVVTIFGAGGKGLAKRRAIAQRLNRRYGIVCLVPEDDFPRGSPSIYEAEYLRKSVIDLVFIYPQSPGSTTYAQGYQKRSRHHAAQGACIGLRRANLHRNLFPRSLADETRPSVGV